MGSLWNLIFKLRRLLIEVAVCGLSRQTRSGAETCLCIRVKASSSHRESSYSPVSFQTSYENPFCVKISITELEQCIHTKVIYHYYYYYWAAAKKTLSQCGGVNIPCPGSLPKTTCPECRVSHVATSHRSLMIRVIMK